MRGAPRGDVVMVVGSLVRMRVVLNLPHAPSLCAANWKRENLHVLILKGISTSTQVLHVISVSSSPISRGKDG
jgi:hypothetical protein